MNRTTRSDVEMLMNGDILKIVTETREEIAQHFNVVDEDSPYYRYKGLCDYTCSLIKERIDNRFKESRRFSVECECVHGEQKHTPMIKSKFWPIQHTWLNITIGDDVKYHIYLDPTIEQFRDLYDFSYAIYLEMCKPYWFYPDNENPLFTPLGKDINNNYYIRHRAVVNGNQMMINDGIIEFLQYEVWGRISDLIKFFHTLYMKRKYHKQGRYYKEKGVSL